MAVVLAAGSAVDHARSEPSTLARRPAEHAAAARAAVLTWRARLDADP